MGDLLDRWLAALESDVDPAAARLAGQDLLDRWSQPHRHYHTLNHLLHILSIVDGHAELADDADAVRIAAWFHDAVYDPQSSANEENSALLAREVLDELAFPAHRTREVVRLVLLTAGHRVRADDRDGALLADADLAILAVDAEQYDGYARGVRLEYGHVPDDVYQNGRSAVLRALLALAEADQLYHVVPDADAWTTRARANMRRELAALTRD